MNKREATTAVITAWKAEDHAQPLGVDALRQVMSQTWPELYDALQQLAPVPHETVPDADEKAAEVADELEAHREQVLGQ